MNKNYTLKELADIGAKAAYLAEKESKCFLCHAITVDASKPLYEETSVNREAFTKAVLDAVGYEFPKDEEREAFERWWAGVALHPEEAAFGAWKAGREELRKAVPMLSFDKNITITSEPDWIPWDGGKCPLEDGMIWEAKLRSGTHVKAKGLACRWDHNGRAGDIVAYRVLEG